MIRLERGATAAPPAWAAKVRKKLPASFDERAQAFERLPLNGRERRGGFRRYASEALPRIRKKRDFPPLWRTERTVKSAIGALSDDHCAYCQSPSGADQYGQVEHFKPKSLFPSLAYEWMNYFLSCELCNHHKSDKWPETGGYVRPDAGDPSRRFVFHPDGSVTAAAGDEEAERTIRDFGLNREGLRKKRRIQIRSVLATARAIVESDEIGQAAREDLIGTLRRPDPSAYSVAVNQNLLRL